MRKSFVATTFAALLTASVASAEVLEGTVTEIIDGDEFTLTTDSAEYHIKIAEVKSPEEDWSAPALFSLIKGETVRAATVTPISEEEPASAHVYTKSINVAYELLRLGLVQVDRDSNNDYMKLSIEEEARYVGRGMWKNGGSLD